MSINTDEQNVETNPPDEEFEKIPKKELEGLRKLASQHNKNGATHRKLEEENRQLKGLLSEKERLEEEEAAKLNNHGKQLEIVTRQKAEVEKKLTTLEQNAKRRTKQADVFKECADITTNPNALYRLVEGELDAVEDEENGLITVTKTGEPLKDFLLKKIDELLPESKKNPRKQGTGSFDPEDKSKADDSVSYQNLKNMNEGDRVRAFIKDRKLKEIWLKGGGTNK